MDRDLARRLVALVNDPLFRDLMPKFIDNRIGTLHGQLEKATNFEDVRFKQGQIAAFKQFLTLREEVLAAAEREA